MKTAIPLTCEKCHKVIDVKSVNPFMICPNCNGRLHLEHCLTEKYIKSKKFKSTPPTAWKYLYNLNPYYSDIGQDYASHSIVSLNEGGTPLRVSNLGTKLNLKSLKIKDETRNPTGTFMDRGTTAEMSMCKWLGPNNPKYVIVGSVVGSLAVSLAAYSARAGFECQLFIDPNHGWGLSPSILYQLISYGAKINLISKNNSILPKNYYTFNYNNTFFVEGLKTTGFEICDQLGGELPDHIVVPMGRGTHLHAIYRSILEMISLGLVKNGGAQNKKTTIHGVTTEHNLLSNREELSYNDIPASITDNKRNSYAVAQTSLLDKSKQIATTIAPELNPPGTSYLEDAKLAINNTGGSVVKVSDNDLINAVSLLASHDGVFASPAGASSIAGLIKLIESNLIQRDENVVCIVTMSEGSVSDSIKNWKVLQAYNRLRPHQYLYQEPSHSLEKRKKKTNNSNDDSILLGNTKRKILLLLKEQPDYVYNLRKRLLKKYSVSLDISTLYQHLMELEKKGTILRSKAESFRGKPIRFYYNITPVGNTFIQSR